MDDGWPVGVQVFQALEQLQAPVLDDLEFGALDLVQIAASGEGYLLRLPPLKISVTKTISRFSRSIHESTHPMMFLWARLFMTAMSRRTLFRSAGSVAQVRSDRRLTLMEFQQTSRPVSAS